MADILAEALAEEAAGARLLVRLARQDERRQVAQELLAERQGGLFYKVVARAGSGVFVSIFDGTTEYRVGTPTLAPGISSSSVSLLAPAAAAPVAAVGDARPDIASELRPARLFAYASLGEALQCPFPKDSQLSAETAAARAILQVVGMGEPEYHSKGKFSFPGLLPVAVLRCREWRNEFRWR
eukprot:TRINITY_DN18591_c0_g1_i1.p1 TRINITY_DN18591_c0_g1~~TRINITY_DN18591_c0_g1_i1.p1  ORF type:complete len:183 (+),score=25.03 TRINITY_DN18591_c0_g1_i1:333-881(+)